MFCGLSMRMASLILRSLSGQLLETVILWNSDCFGLLGVGCSTTCGEHYDSVVIQKPSNSGVIGSCCWFIRTVVTFPSSLSSSANTPVFSVNSLTLTAGKGCVVVKSPCVPQLELHAKGRKKMAQLHTAGKSSNNHKGIWRMRFNDQRKSFAKEKCVAKTTNEPFNASIKGKAISVNCHLVCSCGSSSVASSDWQWNIDDRLKAKLAWDCEGFKSLY